MAITYYKGAELPNVLVSWFDSQGAVIDFSTGYTFTVKIGKAGQSALLTKTTGIVGAATEPNITISWNTDDLAALNPDTYDMNIIANLTSGNKDRIQSTPITILAIVT